MWSSLLALRTCVTIRNRSRIRKLLSSFDGLDLPSLVACAFFVLLHVFFGGVHWYRYRVGMCTRPKSLRLRWAKHHSLWLARRALTLHGDHFQEVTVACRACHNITLPEMFAGLSLVSAALSHILLPSGEHVEQVLASFCVFSHFTGGFNMLLNSAGSLFPLLSSHSSLSTRRASKPYR